MRHRWFWELYHGPIPTGYEVDHKCKNRRCFNPNHCQLLAISEHRSKDNRERYLQHYRDFKGFVLKEGIDDLPEQSELGRMFNKSQSTISKWLKKLREEEIH